MLGLSVGLTDEQMAAMAAPETCASFSEVDRLVLRYAETLTRDNRVDDALYAALATHFDTTELMELAVTVGLSALVNRVHATFKTDVDESTVDGVQGMVCMLPPR